MTEQQESDAPRSERCERCDQLASRFDQHNFGNELEQCYKCDRWVCAKCIDFEFMEKQRDLVNRAILTDKHICVDCTKPPKCDACGHEIVKVREEQYETIVWTWDKEKGELVKDEPNLGSGDSDRPRHICEKCPDGSEDELEEGVVDY